MESLPADCVSKESEIVLELRIDDVALLVETETSGPCGHGENSKNLEMKRQRKENLSYSSE